jgi:hypothetical protein
MAFLMLASRPLLMLPDEATALLTRRLGVSLAGLRPARDHPIPGTALTTTDLTPIPPAGDDSPAPLSPEPGPRPDSDQR